MQTLDQPADLQRLVFLITGKTDSGMEATPDSPHPDSDNRFFSAWVEAWSRRIEVAKALATVREELADSARRTASRRPAKKAFPSREWSLDQSTTKIEIGGALLSIDLFPRCVLLLSIFEGVPLEDVAVLLDSDLKLVSKARAIGLQELTRNLARIQGWTPGAASAFLPLGEWQHA